LSCEDCSRFHRDFERVEPPCNTTCPKPELMPENEMAWNLAIQLTSQLRFAGMSGVIVGFDFAVLPMYLTAYFVPQSEWQFYIEKITAVGRIMTEYWKPDTPTKD